MPKSHISWAWAWAVNRVLTIMIHEIHEHLIMQMMHGQIITMHAILSFCVRKIGRAHV